MVQENYLKIAVMTLVEAKAICDAELVFINERIGFHNPNWFAILRKIKTDFPELIEEYEELDWRAY